MTSAQKNFSSTLMGLKFMQRSKEKAKRQEVEEKKEEKDAEAHWETKTQQSAVNCLVIMESAPKPAAALGRLSFNNFNPVIERLAAEQRELMPKSKAKATPSKESTVSDEAMAQR
ncbi:hypothetical protein CYMTET_29419 [Cymbomonas tetramitiformis]|uniref:M-phase phosphoprotein 6 n=1 Tax=Cymbomonas tetramitiformis TaxID=36881 RepID=A0AAE0FKW0_9CHLO|nr:hypothetical protein CYMTET_29419 [Cymbomonas tetramitiformis]